VHASLAAAIVRVAEVLREESGCSVVGLTGGVFQNRLLTELATDQLGERGFRVLLAAAVPPNDGGLSYGQVAEFLGRLR
jgi:hydrogenase maturation protein HypF